MSARGAHAEYADEVDLPLCAAVEAGTVPDFGEISANSGASIRELRGRFKVLQERDLMRRQFHGLPDSSVFAWRGLDLDLIDQISKQFWEQW